MHHKRHRTKNRRQGCLECKPWKGVGVGEQERFRPSELRRVISARAELHEYRLDTRSVARIPEG